MPERLDHVTIALGGGDVTLSWDARQALLARLEHVHESSSLRAMFEAVGATRPVELNPAQRATPTGARSVGLAYNAAKAKRPRLR